MNKMVKLFSSVLLILLIACSQRAVLDKLYKKSDYSGIMQKLSVKLEDKQNKFIDNDMFVTFIESKHDDELNVMVDNYLKSILIKSFRRNEAEEKFVTFIESIYKKGFRFKNQRLFVSELFDIDGLNPVNTELQIRCLALFDKDMIFLEFLKKIGQPLDRNKWENLVDRIRSIKNEDFADLWQSEFNIIKAEQERTELIGKIREVEDRISKANDVLIEAAKDLAKIQYKPIPYGILVTGRIVDINLNETNKQYMTIYDVSLATNGQIIRFSNTDRFLEGKKPGDIVTVFLCRIDNMLFGDRDPNAIKWEDIENSKKDIKEANQKVKDASEELARLKTSNKIDSVKKVNDEFNNIYLKLLKKYDKI